MQHIMILISILVKSFLFGNFQTNPINLERNEKKNLGLLSKIWLETRKNSCTSKEAQIVLNFYIFYI